MRSVRSSIIRGFVSVGLSAVGVTYPLIAPMVTGRNHRTPCVNPRYDCAAMIGSRLQWGHAVSNTYLVCVGRDPSRLLAGSASSFLNLGRLPLATRMAVGLGHSYVILDVPASPRRNHIEGVCITGQKFQYSLDNGIHPNELGCKIRLLPASPRSCCSPTCHLQGHI